MARVAVPEALALGSNRERALEERLEGVVPDGIINRILQHHPCTYKIRGYFTAD